MNTEPIAQSAEQGTDMSGERRTESEEQKCSDVFDRSALCVPPLKTLCVPPLDRSPFQVLCRRLALANQFYHAGRINKATWARWAAWAFAQHRGGR